MAPPTIPPSYIWVHTVVWECGKTHRRPWPTYILPRLCLTRNVTTFTDDDYDKNQTTSFILCSRWPHAQWWLCPASSCTSPAASLAWESSCRSGDSGICSRHPRLVDTPRCEPLCNCHTRIHTLILPPSARWTCIRQLPLKDDMQRFFTKLMQKSFLAAYCNINPSV